MIIKFVLSFSDYLTYHCRRKSWLMRSAVLFLLGAACYKSNFNGAIFFGFAGVLFLIFHPFFQRRNYEDLYKKFVLENYAIIAGKESTTMDFYSEYITVQRPSFEQKIYISEICEINEIGTHFFIKIKTPASLVIPKNAIENSSFGNALIKLYNNPNIIITKELDWKWR